MLIRIKNLRLRTIIGINDWERKDLQDVVINVEIEYDGAQAAETDEIEHGVNYRSITKRIIREVEQSSFHLLDALAARILEIVMDEESVQKATVEVDKPHALRFADSISVVCSAEQRTMNRVVIGVASNIQPQDNIEKAIALIGQRDRIVRRSRFVETKPIGRPDQSDFQNGAVLIETAKDREELRRRLREIEAQLDRVRTADKFAPRTIDLDIVVWNGEVVDPDFHQRDFLRHAVVEVLPELDADPDAHR